MDDYIKFLSLGSSVSIIDALAVIHIDLADGNYVDDTIKVLEQQLSELDSLME